RAGENQPAVAQGDASASRRNAVDNGSRRQRKEERHAERERENTPLHQSQDDGNRATENEQAVHNGRLKDSITHQLGPASSAQCMPHVATEERPEVLGIPEVNSTNPQISVRHASGAREPLAQVVVLSRDQRLIESADFL